METQITTTQWRKMERLCTVYTGEDHYKKSCNTHHDPENQYKSYVLNYVRQSFRHMDKVVILLFYGVFVQAYLQVASTVCAQPFSRSSIEMQ